MKIILIIILINILILSSLPEFELKVYNKIVKFILNPNMYFFFKNVKYFGLDYNKSKLLYLFVEIILILILPILSILYVIFLIYLIINDKRYILRFLSCSIKDTNSSRNLDFDKITWYNLFKKHNIQTPTILASIDNSLHLKIYDKLFDKNKEYILKPVIGYGAKNITFISYNNLLNKINNNEFNVDETFLFQERIYDCKTKKTKPRHIRIYSVLTNNEIEYITFSIFNGNKNSVASNYHQGGNIVYCFELLCKELTDDEKNKLKYIGDKLKKLHKNIKKDLIGWDIILACNSVYVLEGNVCPGTRFLDEKTNERYNKLYENVYS